MTINEMLADIRNQFESGEICTACGFYHTLFYYTISYENKYI